MSENIMTVREQLKDLIKVSFETECLSPSGELIRAFEDWDIRRLEKRHAEILQNFTDVLLAKGIIIDDVGDNYRFSPRVQTYKKGDTI